jgi:hypothetical protein
MTLFLLDATTSKCTPVPEMVWHLSVGKAIGLVGLVAAAYPIFGDPIVRKLENDGQLWLKRLIIVLWIGTFTALMAMEWRSITVQEAYQDKQHTFEMCLQQQRFDATIAGLNVNLGTTQDTLSGVKEAVSGIGTNIDQTKEALNLFTGEKSFPYLDFDSPDFLSGYAKKIGRYPVYDVTVNFGIVGNCGNMLGLGACRFGEPSVTKTFPEINDATPTPTPASDFPYSKGIRFTRKKKVEYSEPTLVADITARNGLWREYFTWATIKDPKLGVAGVMRNERDIRIYETLRDSKGRPNGENLIWECRTKYMHPVNWDLDNLPYPAVYIYGKLAHLKEPEEGPIDSGIKYKTPVDCDLDSLYTDRRAASHN